MDETALTTTFVGDQHNLVLTRPSSPTAGSNLIWRPPDNIIVQIVSVVIRLVTSEKVADRLVCIHGNTLDLITFLRSPSYVLHPGNRDWIYYFAVGIQPYDNSADKAIYAPLASDLQLDSDGLLEITVNHMDVGDRLSTCAIRYFAWQKGRIKG